MKLLYKVLILPLLAFLLPLTGLGISGYLAVNALGERAGEQSARSLIEVQQERISELTLAKAVEFDQLCARIGQDVEHLRLSFEHVHAVFRPEAPGAGEDPDAALYPGADTAGLPGYGTVDPGTGAYADWDDRGPAGPWVRTAVVERVRREPALRERVARLLHEVVALQPFLRRLGQLHGDTLDLAWVVLVDGVTDTWPNYDYRALVAERPDIVTTDEAKEDYVRLLDPMNDPQRARRWLVPYLDRFKGVWMTSCVAPVYEGDTFLGTVGMDVLLPIVTERILRLRLGRGGYAFLLAGDGRVVALPEIGVKDLVWDETHRRALRQTLRPAEEQRWDPALLESLATPLDQSPDPALRALATAMIRGAEGSREIDLAGERKIVAFAPMAETGWRLGLVAPRSELVAPAESVARMITAATSHTLNGYVFVALGALALSAVVGLLFYRLTVRPLTRFTKQVASLRWDRLSFEPVARPSGDEFGQLYARFGDLVRAIRRSRDALAHEKELLAAALNEKRQLEDEVIRAQKLETVRLLAAGIAHDFNNLLAAILGNVSVAQQSERLDEEAAARLRSAEKACLRARDLTGQLLTFSTAGAPVRRPIALPGVLMEAAGFALRGSPSVVAFNFAPDLWPVEADESQISQVAGNLVLNAVQAMQSGGTIHVSARNVTLAGGPPAALSEGRYVEVSIRDEGPGIAPDDLPRLFDPFFTTKPKGTGLGLAVCQSILRRHEGAIEARSGEVGPGATFRFWLPASTRAPEAEAPRALPLPRGTGRILVMDDDDMVREMFEAMLRRLGYEVEVAAGGEAAVARFEEGAAAGRSFDAVILDLTIPGGMGGIETLAALQQRDPAVRAIISSGYPKDAIFADSRAHGFAAAIPKPFDTRTLAETVARVLAAAPAGGGGASPGA